MWIRFSPAIAFALLGLAWLVAFAPPARAESLALVKVADADLAEWETILRETPDPSRVVLGGEEWRAEAVGPAGGIVLRRTGPDGKTVSLPGTFSQVALGRPQPACLLVAGIESEGAETRIAILSYNIYTERWHTLDRFAAASGTRMAWKGPALFAAPPTPENGARPKVQRYEIVAPPVSPRLLDVIVIGLYLAAMLGIGLYFARNADSGTAGYFLADRELNWFVGGVTLYATATSAISFVSIPAKSFATNWQYMASNYVSLLGTTVAAFVIVPALRRMNLVSVYEYLETRFHPSIRSYGSAVTILYNTVGKQAIVILLPAMTLQQMMGVSLTWSVVAIGLLTTIYTVVGGFRAVVWTDLAQCFVMLGGAAVGVWWICHAAGVDVAGMFREASALGKTHTFSLEPSLVAPTLWAFLLMEIFNVLSWPKDQMLMQRVFATRNEAHARGSAIFLAALVIPGATLFFAIGTALFVFYRAHPERFVPIVPTDSLFPMFIAAEMPAGLSGLLIAAILAASMSTLSSGISSLSTLTRVDFLDRFRVLSGIGARTSNRTLVFVYGALATVSGVIVSKVSIGSLLDFGFQAFAILGGGFAAAYGLGFFTRTARWEGVLVGIAASAVASFVLVRHVSPILMQATTIGISLVVGYVASLIIARFAPAPRS